MRRRSKKQEAGAGFSLFSYLDGLLCTMGALIIVLICISRGARFSHKNSSGEPGDGPSAAEIAEDLQNTEWRTKHMVAAREKTLKDLQDARSQLSHLEDHTLRLRKQFEELVAAEKALAEGQTNSTDERLRSEVVRLRKAVADAQAEVDEARKRAESRKPSYAIVPYQGPNQTRRRPIYVECTSDRVILQPEGIELTPNDFAGPMGAGNPLAAALRAEREYLYEQNDANQLQEEPYPLLLIRPDGIDAYCAAREAMQSWSSDFGYELIDQDWKLEYQPPNRELAELTQSVVNEARKRQQFLARSMPRQANEEQWYRAAPSGGGVVPDGSVGGGTGAGGPGRGSGRGARRDPASSFVQRGSRPAARGGGGGSGLGDGAGRGNGVGNGARGHGDNGDSTGSGGYGPGGAGRASGYPKGDGDPDGPNPYVGIADGIGSGQGGTGAGLNGTGAGGQGPGGVAGQTGNPGGRAGAAGAPGAPGIGAPGPGGAELTKNGATGPGGSKPGGTANSANGGTGDGTGPELNGPNGGAGSGAARGPSGGSQPLAAGSGGAGQQGGVGGSGGGAGGQSGGQQGGAQSAAAGGSNTPGGNGSASAGGGTGGGMPNLQFGQQPQSDGAQPNGAQQSGVTNRPNGTGAAGSTSSSGGSGAGSAQNSIASQQGKDWALPEESRHAVPIARPVVVECRSDKLVVHADGATSKVVKEIPMQGATIDSVNELVGTVSEQAATWGAAGRGMYWKPSLSVQVAPGGEARYADLQKLMENSGLDVRSVQAPPKQVAKPKRWFGLMK
jgi:hypothetical protein